MKITDTEIEETIIDLKPLDHIMETTAFIRAGQWDYERVTYDYKVGSAEENITYYIRVQGHAIEGDVDRGNAVIKLGTPMLGKHYYPHGVEYGEEEGFPESLIDRTKRLLTKISKELNDFKQ